MKPIILCCGANGRDDRGRMCWRCLGQKRIKDTSRQTCL